MYNKVPESIFILPSIQLKAKFKNVPLSEEFFSVTELYISKCVGLILVHIHAL